MKYFIIYKDDHFLGYCVDKKILNNFLNHRKGKYEIYKIKESEIPEKLKNSFEFTNYELLEYTNYYTNNDTPVFNYEAIDMENLMVKDALAIQSLSEEVIHNLKYFKLTDEELKIIKYSFERLIEDLNCITDSNEVIYDEIFNINKYFYERYFPIRRDTKDIIENSFIQEY